MSRPRQPDATPRARRREASPDRAAQSAGTWGRALLLLVITVLLYAPSYKAGFVWDDDLHVTRNPITQPGGLYTSWFTTHQPNYWPVTWTWFWVQWNAWGERSSGYHVVSVLVHAANAVLLFRLLLALGVPAAWFAALLFAIHPVNTETAAWITQQKTLLGMLFMLLSLLAYLRFDAARQRSWYALALAAFLVSLLAKPAAVMMPFMLLGYSWWREGRIGRRAIVAAVPFFAVAACLTLLEIWFQTFRSGAGTVVRTDTLLQRIAGAGYAVWFYAGKVVFPVNLCFVYPKWRIDPASVAAWIPSAALGAVLGGLWAARRRTGNAPLVGVLIYVAHLVPVMGFVNIFFMRYSYAEDHWQYIAAPALIATIVGSAAWYVGGKLPAMRKALALTGGIVACVLAAGTWTRQAVFKDIETLYRRTIEANPDAVLARTNLGSMLYRRGEVEEGIAHLKHALKVDPSDPEAHAVYGNYLYDTGRYAEALEEYRAALPLIPGPERYKLHFEIGDTQAKLGRWDDAAAGYRAALDLKPDLPLAHGKLAFVLSQSNDTTGVLHHLGRAAELSPNWAEAHQRLADALRKSGRPAEAVESYRKALSLGMGSPELIAALADALVESGRRGDAVRELKTATVVFPKSDLLWQRLAAIDTQTSGT